MKRWLSTHSRSCVTMELIHDYSLDTSASERRSVPGQGDTTGTLLSDEVVSYLCHEYVASIRTMFAARVRAVEPACQCVPVVPD